MSTRSAVGQMQEDGSVIGVYVHWDGYLSGVGQQLIDWVAGQPIERRKFVIDKLMAEKIGWSALCGTNIDLPPAWNERSYEALPEECAPQSYTARGEDGTPRHEFASIEEFNEYFEEYSYVFSADMQELIVSVGYKLRVVGAVSLDQPFDLESTIHAMPAYKGE